MKILMFSTDYHPDSGGIAKHIYYLSRALYAEGEDLTLIGGHRTLMTDTRRDAPFQEITLHRTGPKGWRSLKFLSDSFMVLKTLSSESWDVIHFHNFYLDGILLGWLNWPKTKIRIMTNHSSLLLNRLDHKKRLTDLRLVTHKVDGFITPSRELQEKTHQLVNRNIPVEYIANGVDTERFAPILDKFNYQLSPSPQLGRKIILAVRRHEYKCGIHILIQAWPKVIQYYPDALLWLIGEGDQTTHLKKMVHDLNLGNSVSFLGTISHEALPSYYHSAYVSVLPSIYEAVSLSGLESLACGCPVVGTNVGGIPEFLKHKKTGLLVEANSVSGLASALINLLGNSVERDKMGSVGSDYVKNNFSWSIAAKKTISFYQRMIDLKLCVE